MGAAGYVHILPLVAVEREYDIQNQVRDKPIERYAFQKDWWYLESGKILWRHPITHEPFLVLYYDDQDGQSWDNEFWFTDEAAHARCVSAVNVAIGKYALLGEPVTVEVWT